MSTSAMLAPLLLANLLIAHSAAQCSGSVFSLPVNNVTLTNGATTWGLALGIGYPSQQVAVIPHPGYSNLFLYGSESSGNCNESISNVACVTRRGDLYDTFTSYSCSPASVSLLPNDTLISNKTRWVTDTATLTPIHNLPQVLVEVRVGGDTGGKEQNVLGLAQSSAILANLFEFGDIASNVWSIFWGLVGSTANAQMEGSLTFGGYDRAKTSGKNHTQSLANNSSSMCSTRLTIHINDIELEFPSGVRHSLVGSNTSAIPACVDPYVQGLMTLPHRYYQAFENITRASNIGRASDIDADYNDLLYSANSVFRGNLSITLSSGLRVTIPNDQFVLPHEYIDNNTGQYSINGTDKVVAISPLEPNSAEVLRLGRLFLTSAYLMVNYDESKFTLWAAKPTTDQDLVAVNPSCSALRSHYGYYGGSGVSLGVGAIIAIAVGAYIFVTSIVIAVFFIRRTRRTKRRLTLMNDKYNNNKNDNNNINDDKTERLHATASVTRRAYPTSLTMADDIETIASTNTLAASSYSILTEKPKSARIEEPRLDRTIEKYERLKGSD